MSTKDLLRWSGMASILGGLLITLATIIHPWRETAVTILTQELRAAGEGGCHLCRPVV